MSARPRTRLCPLSMLLLAICSTTTVPARAHGGATVVQYVDQDQDEYGAVPSPRTEAPAPAAGHTARSSVGEIGQRQTGAETLPGVKSTARIANRIQNRVQSRIQNRIDRNYDPNVGTNDLFTAASDQARVVPKN